jgi:hypothetical protein
MGRKNRPTFMLDHESSSEANRKGDIHPKRRKNEMKTPGILIPIFVVMVSMTVSAAVFNVPGDFATIQEALDSRMIIQGDTVLVQPGTYPENINFNGHNVVVGSLFLTTGDRLYITSTIIDGDSSGSAVTFENDEDSSAAIIGFTISNGYAENGGGVLCLNSEPTISDNIIIENTAGREGGGIYCSHSNPVIRNNTIIENQAVRGGGICYKYCNPAYAGHDEDYEFIARRNALSPIANNVISKNSAILGGGIYCLGCNLLMRNNTITGNSAEQGGGLFCIKSNPIITSTIFWGNSSDDGPQIHGSSVRISYSDIQGGWDGDGNIDLDPLFRDAENGDFHLANTYCGDADDSPCIDAGNPGINDSLIDCARGLGTVLADMGAYGGGAAAAESETIVRIPHDFQTIQQGINVVSDDDTVLVYPGTYVENIDFDGRGIMLGSLFLFTGNKAHTASTVIDGDSSGTVVTFENGEDSSAVIAGFSIVNGLAENGGGIFCFYSAPTIRDNIIGSNTANSEGGGIFCFYSNPSIKNNVIRENSATSGGGINCRYSNPAISGNLIIRNGVSWEGGGIFCRDNSAPLIQNNDVRENWADYGGGIMCRYSNPSISNTVVSLNSANRGGGIFCAGSNPSAVNITITQNSAELGGGIFCLNSSPLINNGILWYNIADEGPQIYGSAPQITYSDIQGGWEGQGNIDLDPLFRDLENGDFHLMAVDCGQPFDSPCVDAGDPAISDSLLDCSWGLGTTSSDMGAYGGGSILTAIDGSEFGLPRCLVLAGNYPNPFNVSTSIRYNLPEASNLSIEIFNILGQQVATLMEGFEQAGEYTIIWNASDLPSGVYFARLETGKSIETIKMLLLK